MADDKNFVAQVAGESDNLTNSYNTEDMRESILLGTNNNRQGEGRSVAGGKSDTGMIDTGMVAASTAADSQERVSEQTQERVRERAHKRVHIDRGSDEYLESHPRMSAVVTAWVSGLSLLLGCAVVFYLGIWTLTGQRLDYWMFTKLNTVLEGLDNPVLAVFIDSRLIIIISSVMIALALIISLARKRFYTTGIISIFVAISFLVSFTIKRLPHMRPVLDSLIPDPLNSAPSGHTALTVIAGMALVMAVPRVLRALTATWAAFFTTMVGVMVVTFKWHRPTDVYTAIMLVGGLALIAMSFTRNSGLDKLGTRTSSASVQIFSTVFMVLGIAGIAFGIYVISQIYGLIQYQSDDYAPIASYGTVSLIFGFSLFVYALALAIRQATASPLTRSGLVGAPPAPPSVKKARSNKRKK